MDFIKRYFKAPNTSFFLLGPRGTGKSTFLRQHYKNALWFDCLDPETERLFYTHPERLTQMINAKPHLKLIIIDEVQRVPQVLTVVHQMIEADKSLQFILTGSSSRKLKRSNVDLLAGRALNCTFHPFIATELGDEFDLTSALHNGLIPLILKAENPPATLQAYISLYLREEVLMEGLVRNLDDFSRFLEAVSFSHASILNLTNIGRECGVKRKTVENYIHILKDLLLAFELPVFTKKAQRLLALSPKFYLFDAGVFRALRPKGPLDYPEEIDGMALEGLVAQHLRAWNDYTGQEHQLSFWRTRAGLEVDFIVYGVTHFWAIEVKNTHKIYNKDVKGLNAFLSDYPMAKGFLLHRGKDEWQEGKIHYMPCDKFLREILLVNENH